MRKMHDITLDLQSLFNVETIGNGTAFSFTFPY